MRAFSRHEDDSIMSLEVSLYNKVYSHVYSVLREGLGGNDLIKDPSACCDNEIRPEGGGDCLNCGAPF